MSGDSIQLHQAVSNLLTNAEEALIDTDGARCIRVVTRAGATGVEVQVSDTGPGIAPHQLPRLFEPMFTTRADRGNRGLGLTIARAIVQDHGGTLEVHASAGDGAVFTLSFPALPEPTTAARETDDALGAAVPKGSLLLIEDEITLRSAISRYLRNAGYVVDVAEGGAEALDLAADRPYDLILLDLRMNGLTGEQVYQSIESRDPEQAQRVVFMTGDLHNADASRFIRRTGRPVLAKPFTLLDLETRVAQLLQEPR
jgi:two-component system NtrC family sensor kinase